VRLLQPIPLGQVAAPNRLMFGPHVTNLGNGRELSHRHVAYYTRRAAGGAGIVVTETASVHDGDWPYERAPLAASCRAGWEAVAAACRPYGTLALASIGHVGGQGNSAYSQRELWAPSGVPEVDTREMPKVMEASDVAAVVDGFAWAARIATTAGLAGVEINAGQHSLVRQFMSGLTNNRSDGYGSDRLRFAREVIAAVRGELRGGILGLRLCCDELAPWAGITPERSEEIATELAPLIDYLTVVRGSIYSVAATRPDSHTEPGFNLPLAASIREAVRGRVPVFAQGSIVDAAMAELALVSGDCDGVEMTRAQIADAELGRKIASDMPPRPCILCNQACQVLDSRNPIVSCVADPRSGHELEDEPVDHGESERTIGTEELDVPNIRGRISPRPEGGREQASNAEPNIRQRISRTEQVAPNRHGEPEGGGNTQPNIRQRILGTKQTAPHRHEGPEHDKNAQPPPHDDRNDQECGKRTESNIRQEVFGTDQDAPHHHHHHHRGEPEGGGNTQPNIRQRIVATEHAAAHHHEGPKHDKNAEPNIRSRIFGDLAGHSAVQPGRPARRLNLLVIGGGPAGLEAARVAAVRGHRVVLAEATGSLGGQVETAATAPTRKSLVALTGWLAAECRRLGVEIKLGYRVTVQQAATHPGPVVVATGSRDGDPSYEIADGGRVVWAQAFLAGITAGLPEGHVLVWDPIGGPIGVSVAELLAERGPTTLAFPDQIPGQQLALSGDLVDANTRLQSAGVELARRCVLRRVRAGCAEVEDIFGAGTRDLPAALVIDAGPRLPAPLCGAGPGVVVAGDAQAPRTIYQAILEGRRAVLELEGANPPTSADPLAVRAAAAVKDQS